MLNLEIISNKFVIDYSNKNINEDNNITEYSTLIQTFRENEYLSQFMEIAMTKTIFLNTYLSSNRHKEKTS